MMKEKFEKATAWVKEHKGEIVGAAMVIAGGAIVCKSAKILWDARKITDMPIPENWGHGTVDVLRADPTGIAAAIKDIPTADLATLGEDLAKIQVPEQFKYSNIIMFCLEDKMDNA